MNIRKPLGSALLAVTKPRLLVTTRDRERIRRITGTILPSVSEAFDHKQDYYNSLFRLHREIETRCVVRRGGRKPRSKRGQCATFRYFRRMKMDPDIIPGAKELAKGLSPEAIDCFVVTVILAEDMQNPHLSAAIAFAELGASQAVRNELARLVIRRGAQDLGSEVIALRGTKLSPEESDHLTYASMYDEVTDAGELRDALQAAAFGSSQSTIRYLATRLLDATDTDFNDVCRFIGA